MVRAAVEERVPAGPESYKIQKKLGMLPVVVAVKVTEVPAGTEAGAGEMLRVGGVGPKEPLKQLVRTRGKAHAGRVKMARRRFMGVPRLVPIEGRISPVCAGG
jgi:hypothetical protein